MTHIVNGTRKNENGELVTAKYEITDLDKHYVRKVKTFGSIEDFVEPDLYGVDEESAEVNTLILADHLRLKGLHPIVKQKKYADGKYSVIRCKGFEMYYHSHGFRIHDMENFHTPVNMNEYNNDFNNVDSVVEFLKNPPVQATPVKEVSAEETAKKETVAKLSKKFKVVELKEKAAVAEKAELTAEEIPAEVKKCFVQFQSKQINTTEELKNTLYEMIPTKYRKFKIQIGKFCTEINRRNFARMIKDVEAFCNEFDFDGSTKRPAPKFTGGDLPIGDFDSIQVNNETRLVTFEYDGYTVELPRGAFYARYAMSLEPRTMPIFMKLINGKLTLEQIEEMYFNEESFIDRDRFTEYQGEQFHALTDDQDDDVTQAAQYMISAFGEYDPAQMVFKNSSYYRVNESHLTLNHKVRVFWPDTNAYYIGMIVGINKGGVRVRYEDGEVQPLLKSQKVKAYK